METDPQSASIFTQLLILLVLTLIRGYFAGAEMAVASVNKNKIHRLKEQGNKKAALIERLMEGSTAFLSATQLIVTLAGFLSSAAAATGISEILAVKMNQWGIPGSRIAALVLVTIILVYVNLVFGELIPKRIALQNAEKFSLSCIGLVYFASCVVKPFVGLLNVSTSGILKLFGMHHEDLDGTMPVRYPVLQGEDNLTYINKDVYGNFALAGSIFLDSNCDRSFQKKYSLLYGHHMAEHKMFGDLDLYEKQKFFDKNQTGTLVLPDRSYKLEIFACIKTSANEDNIFIPQKWQKSTDGLLKYAEKSAKYIHQDTMKKIGTSKDFSQILAMSTCSSDYTDARTVILAVMKPYSPEK